MFFYSLPLFFTQTQFGSPFELFLITLTLFIGLFISTPPYADGYLTTPPSIKSLYDYLLYTWYGQLSLSQVFWPFFLLLNLGIFSADYSAKEGWISVSSWDDAHFMFFIPSFFWAIAVWRSSENTQTRTGAAYARLMTIAVFFEYALKLLIRYQYPRIFFNCQESLIDYVSCF